MPVLLVPGEAPLELDDVSDDPEDPGGAPDEEAAPVLLPEAGVSGAAPAGGMLGVLGIVALGLTGVGAVVPADDPVVPPGVPDAPDFAPVPASLLQPASRAARMLAATSTLDGWVNDFIAGSFRGR
ncbi:hypothetical protein [Lacisediminimonas profundi]|uniref:hypothetical protein n=1 Tax=Lacisediminimonas profundi TaxID=2603856 RepID=UPI00124BC2E3|nr:hypothetical protein [Lacisediminimonas profundi]